MPNNLSDRKVLTVVYLVECTIAYTCSIQRSEAVAPRVGYFSLPSRVVRMWCQGCALTTSARADPPFFPRPIRLPWSLQVIQITEVSFAPHTFSSHARSAQVRLLGLGAIGAPMNVS